ncbi:MAG TPA: BTAD domain-containing putative transcriptional regulator [Gaiellaceae bacterium]|nr:BTAD domain-containing putative transcriptional regulator [Gaiellaceae bacterium]
MSPATQLRSVLAVCGSLAALAILWRFRPEWPALPGSLSSPVTTTLLHELTLVAAWLLAALVIFFRLVQSLGGIRTTPRLNVRDVTGHTRAASTSQSRRLGRPRLLRPLAAEPRLLVAMPREAPSAPPADRAVNSTSKRPAGAVAQPDERPLVSLLGPLTVFRGKQSRRGLRARALELIAFLALRREGAQRDEILEALWPGEDPNRSRHRLYQAARDARRLLGDGVASERDRYWLDRRHVRVDVDELEELLEQLNAGNSVRQARRLESALALFRAEPLAGCDYAWSDGAVRSLRGAYVELIKRVGRARLASGDARGSLQVAERGLAVDALDEEMWRLALEAEGALGLREAVDERYGRLRDLLQERLALEPARETRTLYLRLLGQS